MFEGKRDLPFFDKNLQGWFFWIFEYKRPLGIVGILIIIVSKYLIIWNICFQSMICVTFPLFNLMWIRKVTGPWRRKQGNVLLIMPITKYFYVSTHYSTLANKNGLNFCHFMSYYWVDKKKETNVIKTCR